MKVSAIVEATGGTTTGIRVDDVVERLGSGKRPRVRVTFPNGHVLRTRIGSHDGSAFLPVSAATRDAAEVAAGDEVEIDVAVDDEPVVVAVPEPLAAAFESSPGAKAFFGTLTPSQQKGFTHPIETAKKPETVAARVDKSIAALESGRTRP